jgi:ketosteroid isomerase-like protein
LSFWLLSRCTTASAEDFKMPERNKQPNAAAVVAEHVDALNNCDFNWIMAQYPDDAEFILPNGSWMKGRSEIVNLFLGFCKDRADGGLKGAKFIAEETNVVGDVINVSWRGGPLAERAVQGSRRLRDQGRLDAVASHNLPSVGYEVQVMPMSALDAP